MSAGWSRPWQIAVRRWRSSGSILWCGALLALLILAAFCVPFIALVFTGPLPSTAWRMPSFDHWLGTDQMGGDVLVQLLWAGRASLGFALLASGVSLVLGVVGGALAGYYGGGWGRSLERGARVFESLPLLLMVIAIAAASRLPWHGLALLVGAVAWMPIARSVQRRMRVLTRRDFTTAVRIVGARPARILWHHIAPHLTAVVGERALLAVAHMLLLETALSVLGLGPLAPHVSLGTLLVLGAAEIDTHPPLFIAASVFLTLISYCLTVLADAWRHLPEP